MFFFSSLRIRYLYLGESVSKWTPESAGYPEELGEYHEGDILHPVTNSRNGLRIKSSRWPNKTIPYEISSYMSTFFVVIHFYN